jgi:hypothetical protein
MATNWGSPTPISLRRGFHYYLWLYNFVGNGAAASPI